MESEQPTVSHQPPQVEQPAPSAVVDFLHNEFHFPAIDLYIERQFARRGWLSTLEQAGIMPVIVSTNPFEPEQNESAHVQWWQEHPAELELFEEEQETRRTLLKVLHIGASLAIWMGRACILDATFPNLARNSTKLVQ